MKLGMTEILLIVGLVIILFGGGKIAGLGKALGSSIRDFKKEMREEKAESESANATDMPVESASTQSNESAQSNESNT